MKGTHLIKDMTVTDESDDTRTHKIFKALDEVCYAFDLGKPIWLDANVEEFKRHAKTRFTQDCFIEHVDFDFLDDACDRGGLKGRTSQYGGHVVWRWKISLE